MIVVFLFGLLIMLSLAAVINLFCVSCTFLEYLHVSIHANLEAGESSFSVLLDIEM